MSLDLDQALDYWGVHAPGDLPTLPEPLRELWLCEGDGGEQAWFNDEADAFRYRLFMVALSCNPAP